MEGGETMILPELSKIRRRRDMLHRSRKYFLRASEVYAMLRLQSGFALVPGHTMRSALRDHLSGYGRQYISMPGQFHRPECDLTIESGIYGSFQIDDAQNAGCKIVERYSYDCLSFAARHMPFCCPVCSSSENPLSDFEHRLPIYHRTQQLICLSCWQRWKDFCNQPFYELEELIHKLNQEIYHAQRRQSQRRKANQQLGNPYTQGDVRLLGSETVTDPSL